MERHRVPVSLSWPGPVPTRGLPETVLYDVRLRFRHAGEADADARLEQALAGLAGSARRRRLPVLGTRVKARGPRWQISASLDSEQIELRVGQRVKGNALARLVSALSLVPGARDLQLVAQEEHYARPFSSIGPCSPCAARAFGR